MATRMKSTLVLLLLLLLLLLPILLVYTNLLSGIYLLSVAKANQRIGLLR